MIKKYLANVNHTNLAFCIQKTEKKHKKDVLIVEKNIHNERVLHNRKISMNNNKHF